MYLVLEYCPNGTLYHEGMYHNKCSESEEKILFRRVNSQIHVPIAVGSGFFASKVCDASGYQVGKFAVR